MDTSVIVAIITGVLTLVGVVVTSAASAKSMDAKLDKQQAVFEAHVGEQISHLREQVERHNRVVERTYDLEKNDARQSDEINRLNKRVSILEGAKNT